MKEIVNIYLEKYLSRKDILYRLPVSIPISKAWPKIQKARRDKAMELPLLAVTEEPFWWVLTDSISQQSEEVLALARKEVMFDRPEYEDAFREAMLDEAVYSSVIEGAFTTKKEAREFIEEGRSPKNKSEQMVKNNYEAMIYVLGHIDQPITEQTILDIYSLVTKDTLEPDIKEGEYRNGPVVVRSKREIVHTPPEAELVSEMMNQLIRFLQEEETAPLIKACIAHCYFVYVHPFFDGNGRTARALSYMILLQAGYDFFKYFSISGIIAEERAKYYKAIKEVEDDDFDMTYFVDYYTGMLSRAVKTMEDRLIRKYKVEHILKGLNDLGVKQRIINGAEWLLTSDKNTVTIKAWEGKFDVVTETARQDLFFLEEYGLLRRKLVKRKYEFEILK